MDDKNKLQAIIDEVAVLISNRATSSSPQFIAWKTKAERFLIGRYGEETLSTTNALLIRIKWGLFLMGAKIVRRV